jgi:hypothetical protein
MQLCRLEGYIGRENILEGKRIKFRTHTYIYIYIPSLACVIIEDADVSDFWNFPV